MKKLMVFVGDKNNFVINMLRIIIEKLTFCHKKSLVKCVISKQNEVAIYSAILAHGHAGQLPGDTLAYLCMLCTACFFNV
jgi:hypothetical protein